MTPKQSNAILQVSNDLTMEINQYKFIPEYNERKLIPETMSFREKKFQLERLHRKYCPDCSGGCPSDVYIKEAEEIIKMLGI